jgi:uncharacterized protein
VSRYGQVVSLVVEQIWRYPIKSIGGQQLGECQADERGLLGDRVWAVQDEAGKLGSGKNSRRFTRIAGLLGLTAAYADGVPIVIAPDDTQYPVATGAADAYLGELSGSPVSVRRDTGMLHFDEVPFSLVGTATLAWLGHVPVEVDARRLRPNVVVHTEEPFAEEAWLGRRVRIGSVEAIFDRVFTRCVMVGMEQPGLAESGDVLKRIAERPDVCLAIGGHISKAGVLRVGDPVEVGVTSLAAGTAMAGGPVLAGDTC